jgi:hypothetical protein
MKLHHDFEVCTAVKMWIVFFCVMMLFSFSLVAGCEHHLYLHGGNEDGGSMFLHNIGNHLQDGVLQKNTVQ